MHDHVAVKGDGVARPREVGATVRSGGGVSPAPRARGLVLGAEEVLEATTGDEGRIGDGHDEVERQGVVVPLVDRASMRLGSKLMWPRCNGMACGAISIP